MFNFVKAAFKSAPGKEDLKKWNEFQICQKVERSKKK
jgi:hypothetical protein